jgi:hypothetical protein
VPKIKRLEAQDGTMGKAGTFCSPPARYLERFDLRSERSGELGERTLRTVLMPNVMNVRAAARKCHARHLHGSHLACKHRLNLIARLNALDDRNHEINSYRASSRALRTERY